MHWWHNYKLQYVKPINIPLNVPILNNTSHKLQNNVHLVIVFLSSIVNRNILMFINVYSCHDDDNDMFIISNGIVCWDVLPLTTSSWEYFISLRNILDVTCINAWFICFKIYYILQYAFTTLNCLRKMQVFNIFRWIK